MKKFLIALVFLCSAFPDGWAQSLPSKATPCGSGISIDKLKKYAPAEYQKFLLTEQQTQAYLRRTTTSNRRRLPQMALLVLR